MALIRLVLLLLFCPTVSVGMTWEERQKLDLSAYRVVDRAAGYFDVTERRAYLRQSDDPALLAEIARHRLGRSCRDYLELPVLDHRAVVPSFYEDPDGWHAASRPYLAFEQATHELAAAQMVAEAGDRYHADCLIDLLGQWADSRAFEQLHFTSKRRQAWYQIESGIFAAAMALSIVRDDVADRKADLLIIDRWLGRIAHRHASIKGSVETCCNNHFYRRALYAAMVGVLIGDDNLFQFGISAIVSALTDADADGALPLEMSRGPLAAHYQNYAVMYLVWIAEIAERQGYPIYELEIGGKSLHSLIRFNREIWQDIYVLDDKADGPQQLRYQKDDQYFAWVEPYIKRYPNKTLEEMITIRRPLFNRSAGGFSTLYFYAPLRERLSN